MTAQILTQERLQELFTYSPSTGHFVRRMARGNKAKGSIAGRTSARGYVEISVNHKLYKAHRLAFLYMTGSFPPHEVDHENHVKHDNMWGNLRRATRTENNRNASKRRDNASGVTGVHWCATDNRWKVQIQHKRKRISGGYFSDFFEAVCSRKALENTYKYHHNHGQKL